MAVTSRDPRANLMLARLHFLLRGLGLLAALAAIVGLIWVAPLPSRLESSEGATAYFLELLSPTSPVYVGALLLTGGLAVALAVLLIELLVAAAGAAGRRSALGAQAVTQIGMAAALLVGVNVWSFGHFRRVDLTRDHQFTLPPDLRQELQKLRREGGDTGPATQVIVYQRHKTFGALNDKPDRYDYAGERKVVEKVRDLVDLLRDFDQRLRVEVLDVEDDRYEEKLKRLTEGTPALRLAIERAAENSIFVARGQGEQARVQQLSFHELYQLDKVASREDRRRQGNLVLLGQGPDGLGAYPFVRRILGLEARKPRVGLLVVHEAFTTAGTEPAFTMRGLRKALEANGFEVKDVVLKRNWDVPQPLAAAADTFEESRLDRLDAELRDADEDIKEIEEELAAHEEAEAKLPKATTAADWKRLREVLAKCGVILFGEGTLDPEERDRLREYVRNGLERSRDELRSRKEERDRARKERDKLDADTAAESRRLTDVKAKFNYAISDCDLLLLPRLTRRASGQLLPARLHNLYREQAEVILDFLRAGKPLLACLGPVSEPPGLAAGDELGPDSPDEVEQLLARLGFWLGKQTVLFPSDARAFASRRANQLSSLESSEPPPLDFDSPPSAARLPSTGLSWRPESALRRGLRVTARSVGDEFDLRLRFARPVDFAPPDGQVALGALAGLGPRGVGPQALRPQGGAALGGLAGAGARVGFRDLFPSAKAELHFDPAFLLTATGWNEDQPFVADGRRPRYRPARADDPVREALARPRRGSFAVGAAAEVTVPPAGERARVAVIGQGEVFVGATLGPAQERLLLQTVNWLLGRDEYLPTADNPWSYPRLGLTEDEVEHRQWLWGARLGMPLLFAVLGIVVLLFRRLR